MTTTFDKAMSFILDAEDGYSKDPDDPGNWTGGEVGYGELRGTNYGISAAAYPDLNIKDLTEAEAIEIYRRDYWNACRCDVLPSPLAILVMDSAVNQGPSAAKRLLQKSLNVKQDGIIGPVTISAAQRVRLMDVVPELVAQRAVRYSHTPNFSRNALGWFRRLARCHQTSMEPL